MQIKMQISVMSWPMKPPGVIGNPKLFWYTEEVEQHLLCPSKTSNNELYFILYMFIKKSKNFNKFSTLS